MYSRSKASTLTTYLRNNRTTDDRKERDRNTGRPTNNTYSKNNNFCAPFTYNNNRYNSGNRRNAI